MMLEKKLKGCHFMFVLDKLIKMLGKTDIQVLSAVGHEFIYKNYLKNCTKTVLRV